MVGRLHYYEGHSLQSTVAPVRVMHLLGAKSLIVTNAAGGINPRFSVGDFCMIVDHISFPSLAGNNPLRGPNLESLGPRFPPISSAYSYELRQKAVKAADEISLSRDTLHEGVYCFVGGPSYETPAEIRLMLTLGGDLVGMSTVPEVIVAAHCGMPVLGISLITNKVVVKSSKSALNPEPEGKCDYEPPANHEEVLAVSRARADVVKTWVAQIVSIL